MANTYGGLENQIVFNRLEDIIAIDKYGKLSLKPGSVPILIEVTEKTGSYNVEEAEKNSEEYLIHSYNAIVSDVNSLNQAIIEELQKDEFILCIKTLTGQSKIIGSSLSPIKINVKERVSADHSFNGYELSVIGYNPKDNDD